VNLAIAALNAAGSGRLYFPASTGGCLASGGGLDPITVPCIVMGDGLRSSKVLSDSTTAVLFTSTVSAVENGVRASRPREPTKACACRAPLTPMLI